MQCKLFLEQNFSLCKTGVIKITKLEMLEELKNDNTKIFKCLDTCVKYYVQNGSIIAESNGQKVIIPEIKNNGLYDYEYIEIGKVINNPN